MKPSSSTSDPDDVGLFGAVHRRGGVPALVGDAAYLEAMLRTEAALARAQARAGLVPAEDAAAIAAACERSHFDIGELGRAAEASGTPVVPLVE